MIGQAAEEGLSISGEAVERRLREKVAAFPNGRSEFDEELSSTGQTLADVKLEAKAALSVAALRSAVARRVPALTAAEVSSYYAHHRQRFYLPDRRVVYLIEGIRSHAHARALAIARQRRPDAPFVMPWFREVVPKTSKAADPATLAHLVFAATPGRVAGPTMFFGHWVLAVVKQLIPAGVRPFVAVRSELSKSLTLERGGYALDSFAAALARKWTAMTSCAVGYIVAKCSQYRGAPAQANPLTGA
ncbi:MAG TPA: peptidylprolyl isomerase [Solirubrobacteraceae bacterium]